MHNAIHYATFGTSAHAKAAHAVLHSALNSTAHVVLQRNNTVHVSRTFKQHKKAVKFVNKTVDMFWEACNTACATDGAGDDGEMHGGSDVICDRGHSSY
jgi:predicted nucleic acid-binding protein